MKVVLTQNVPNVGDKDEVIDVAPGYARNFLFAKHLAVLATPPELARVEETKRKNAQEAQKDLERAEKAVQALQQEEIVITTLAAEDGSLYGRVTQKEIREKLVKKGYALDKDAIKLPAPIEKTGEYEVTVSLPHGLEATVTVVVQSEEPKRRKSEAPNPKS